MDISEITDSIYALPEHSKARLMSLVSEVEYPKRYCLFRENIKGSRSYFIKHGLVRAYTIKEGKEITYWFGKDGDPVFPLQTIFADLAEYGSVELLEDSVLYELNLNELQELYWKDIHLANWGRKYAEYACIETEKHFISRQFRTSLEIYENLISSCPDIIQRVPLGVIASYLGISQANLSRIRAKIR